MQINEKTRVPCLMILKRVWFGEDEESAVVIGVFVSLLGVFVVRSSCGSGEMGFS